MTHDTLLTRRSFLQGVLGLGLSTVGASDPISYLLSNQQKFFVQPEKVLSFYNRHTGESLKKCVFWTEGSFVQDSLKQINHLFRDHRTNESHDIDPALINIIYRIQQQLNTCEPIHLISGYRSSKTNEKLRHASGGVAKNSQHLHGKAADIAIPGRTLRQVKTIAQSLKQGGVGLYSQFVHVDTGSIRYWGGG